LPQLVADLRRPILQQVAAKTEEIRTQ